MGVIFDYALIRAVPDPRRGEWVNIGVVVFLDGRLDIHLLGNLSKLRVIAPRLDIDLVEQIRGGWQHLCENAEGTRARHALLERFPLVHASPLARFMAAPDRYTDQVESIMRDLVVPPAAPRSEDRPTRLEAKLRADFYRANLLGQSVDDIDRHKVVPRFPIDASAGLFADFALMNGAMRITETIDFRVDRARRAAKHDKAALKCVTLARAMERYPSSCNRSVVYIADERTLDMIQPSLTMLGNYADRLYDAGSAAEMASYMSMMHAAAGALAT